MGRNFNGKFQINPLSLTIIIQANNRYWISSYRRSLYRGILFYILHCKLDGVEEYRLLYIPAYYRGLCYKGVTYISGFHSKRVTRTHFPLTPRGFIEEPVLIHVKRLMHHVTGYANYMWVTGRSSNHFLMAGISMIRS